MPTCRDDIDVYVNARAAAGRESLGRLAGVGAASPRLVPGRVAVPLPLPRHPRPPRLHHAAQAAPHPRRRARTQGLRHPAPGRSVGR